MKKTFFCVISAFLLSGCLAVQSSPTPRFYMLHSISKDTAVQKFDIPKETIIEIGPVNIPQYLDRPQIVTQDKNKMLFFAQFDRWGEFLDSSLTRVISENLTLMLPEVSLQMFPCNLTIPLKYQVIIDIVQLDSSLDSGVYLVAQWSIIARQNNQMLFTKRSEVSQVINKHSYSGLAEAISAASLSLSTEIAQALSSLQEQEKAIKTK